jgi:hypothetical protein
MLNKPTRMSRLLLTGILLLGAICSLDCRRAAGGDSLLKLVPATSIAVLSARWSEVRQDERLRRLVRGDDIEQALRSVHVSSEAVDDLVMFGNTSAPGAGSSGIILRCSSKARTLVDQLRSQGWEEQAYRARKTYHDSSGQRWLAPLKEERLVLGTRAGVEETLNAEMDLQASLAGSRLGSQLINQVGKQQSPISVLLMVPQDLQDIGNVVLQFFSIALDFTGAAPLGGILNKVGIARGVGCSISRSGNSFPVDLLIIMKDEGAASFVSGALSLLRQASSFVPKNSLSDADKEKFRSYQSLSVTRNHEVLSIKMTMREADLLP